MGVLNAIAEMLGKLFGLLRKPLEHWVAVRADRIAAEYLRQWSDAARRGDAPRMLRVVDRMLTHAGHSPGLYDPHECTTVPNMVLNQFVNATAELIALKIKHAELTAKR